MTSPLVLTGFSQYEELFPAAQVLEAAERSTMEGVMFSVMLAVTAWAAPTTARSPRWRTSPAHASLIVGRREQQSVERRLSVVLREAEWRQKLLSLVVVQRSVVIV